MTHLSQDVLGRYLGGSLSREDRDGVEWHLEHCPICKEEISVKDAVRLVRESKERRTGLVRSAGY
jgi:hypothetical protein